MIVLPKRSVTRFFIPLIDVLILLFCIFLLMPFVSAPAQDDEPEKKKDTPAELPTDVKELQKRLAAANKDRDEAIKRLERHQKERGEKLVVRVLEIDPNTGRLSYYASGKQEIASQEHAEKYIAYEKRLAGEKDVYFSIQYPRVAGRHPTPADIASYKEWFKNVQHDFDLPRSGP
jgi:hypothetical protein